MDRTFEHRTRPYRACVLLLFVSTVLTLVGYCTSHWVDTGHDGHYGLWVRCVSGHGQEAVCNRHSGTTAVDQILQAPQILITLQMAALIIACIGAVFTNCRHYIPTPRERCLELTICLAGLLGSIGCCVFWARKVRLDAVNTNVSMLSWSFFLVFLPSLVILVIACVISCNNDVILESEETNLIATPRSKARTVYIIQPV